MKQIKKLLIFLSYMKKISFSYLVLLIIKNLLHTIQIFSNIILPKLLIDELIMGTISIRLVIILGVIVGINGVLYFSDQLLKKIMEPKQIYVQNAFHGELIQKIANIEYQYLENPYYLDLKERALFAVASQNALEQIVKHLSDVFQLTLTFAGAAILILHLSWILMLLMIGCIIAILLIQKSFSAYQLGFFKELSPLNRKKSYYDGLCFKQKCQKDIRLYHMSGMISESIEKYDSKTVEWNLKFSKKFQVISGIYAVIGNVEVVMAYIYTGIRCITDRLGKRITIGDMTMYVGAATTFSKTAVELGTSIIYLSQMLSLLDPFLELLELPNEKDVGGIKQMEREIRSIRFDHVFFSYPGSAEFTLKDLTFEILQGEKISVVGINGSGKTTLIKLLCRFYKPTEGVIYINGINIYDYDVDSYLQTISAVFQDYKLFNFSIEENVTCKEEGIDKEGAENALGRLGLTDKIGHLPYGVKTLLGREYDDEGTEMSGGQSQKIAIARALYKDAAIVILDEPTSALDPFAEAEIFQQFHKLVGDRTAIFISHRMSSSIFCDKILILDGGEVKEFASHSELMEKTESLYYKLFTAQANNY